MQIFGVGLPELIILIIIAGFVVVPILIAILLNKRFKRSRENKPTNEQHRGAFSSPEGAGRWARGLLVASLILAAIGVISGLLQVELLSRFARGADYTMEEVTRNDSRQGLIGIAQIVLWLGTAIAFLIWFYRVNKNISSLGNTGVIFTPGWAVGFFFVPFLNLVRPFQAMRAVWHGSDPSRPGLDLTSHGPGHGRLLGTPALVGWWWGLFLIFNFIGNAAGRLLISEKTAAGLQSGSSLMVLSDLLEIPGALIAIRLVSHITKWQIEKKRVISQQAAQAAEAPLVSPQ